MIAKRVHALLVFKENELNGISKREVAQAIGVNHNNLSSIINTKLTDWFQVCQI